MSKFKAWVARIAAFNAAVRSPADIAQEKLDAAGTFGQVEGNLTGEVPAKATDYTGGDPKYSRTTEDWNNGVW